jgi:hypothetical protein
VSDPIANVSAEDSRRLRDKILLRNMSAPISGVMRFHLVYGGPLAATGNKSKPAEAKRIRDVLSPQLANLWSTHHALQMLKNSALVMSPGQAGLSMPLSPFDDGKRVQLARGLAPQNFVDLCEPVAYGDKKYMPLVRKSLDLNCGISVLFLRQGDPGSLVNQGGDLDNRIKTLLDALKMPDRETHDSYASTLDMTYCLMESDSLASDLNVKTDRLLFPQTQYPNEVHLVIEVDVQVLRVGVWNVCLV